MPEAEAVIVITGQGLKAGERKQLIRGIERSIYQDIRYSFLPQLGVSAIKMLRAEAPRWTGRLHEGIGVSGLNPSRTRPSIRIGVSAVTDQGFSYVAASRFGRKAVEAKGRSTPARTYKMPAGGTQGGGQKRPFRARMLQFEHTQTVDSIFRRRSRAHKPGGDWVRRAEPMIRAESRDAFEFIGDEIQERIERTSFITGKPVGAGASRHRASVKVRRSTGNIT